jgi:hypothetical protein
MNKPAVATFVFLLLVITTGSINASLVSGEIDLEDGSRIYRLIFLVPDTDAHGRMSGKKPVLNWEAVSLTPSSKFVESIESKLNEEEWLIAQWAPIHLNKLLKDWYFKDGTSEINTFNVWKDTCQYLYLPRLQNVSVFQAAIAKALTSGEYFGYAAGKEADRYQEFAFENETSVSIDHTSLLISHEAAEAYWEKLKQQAAVSPITKQTTDPEPKTGQDPGAPISNEQNYQKHADSRQPPKATPKTRFYGTVELDPVKAIVDFSTLVREVVQHFTVITGSKVTISIEVEASVANGFDDNLQRTMRENRGTLGFKSAEFEEV